MIMFHYVYVLQNDDKEIQAGYALDLSRRLPEYNQELLIPWRLIYCEAYLHLTDAMRRVQYLKSIHGTKLLKQKLRNYLWR